MHLCLSIMKQFANALKTYQCTSDRQTGRQQWSVTDAVGWCLIVRASGFVCLAEAIANTSFRDTQKMAKDVLFWNPFKNNTEFQFNNTSTVRQCSVFDPLYSLHAARPDLTWSWISFIT